jgi:hypothetical protein
MILHDLFAGFDPVDIYKRGYRNGYRWGKVIPSKNGESCSPDEFLKAALSAYKNEEPDEQIGFEDGFRDAENGKDSCVGDRIS